MCNEDISMGRDFIRKNIFDMNHKRGSSWLAEDNKICIKTKIEHVNLWHRLWLRISKKKVCYKNNRLKKLERVFVDNTSKGMGLRMKCRSLRSKRTAAEKSYWPVLRKMFVISMNIICKFPCILCCVIQNTNMKSRIPLIFMFVLFIIKCIWDSRPAKKKKTPSLLWLACVYLRPISLFVLLLACIHDYDDAQ